MSATFRRKEPMRPEAALSRLQGLCAASEQCESDLRKKLAAWGVSYANADAIIRRLERDRFLDNARFATAYAHDKLTFNGWGRHKIAQGLRSKRIDSQIIDEALDSIDPEEYASRAFRVMRTKSAGLEPTRENKMKLLRFGAGRGFEVGLLVDIIKSEDLWEDRQGL